MGMKLQSPTAAMRQLWSQRGTTAAVALSVENGDAPIKNWTRRRLARLPAREAAA